MTNPKSPNRADGIGDIFPHSTVLDTRSGPPLRVQAIIEEKIHRELFTESSLPTSKERLRRLRLPRLNTSQLAAQPVPLQTKLVLSVVVESPQSDVTRRASPNATADLGTGRKIRPAVEAQKNLWFPGDGSSLRCHVESPGANSVRSLSATSIFELDAGIPSPKVTTSNLNEAYYPPIPVEAAEGVLLRILQNIDNLQDLFNAAVINRAFYRIFKKHELPLIKNTLFRMSPAAWELREMSPPWNTDQSQATELDAPVPEYTPSLYLRHYSRDLYTMAALKSLILVRCDSFLRPETASALAGLDETRSVEIDEAFWRVWTFCRIFGCGKGREVDLVGQVDWLTGGRLAKSGRQETELPLSDPFGTNSALFDPPYGFSKGNGEGLTSKELYDMTEIWTCLGALLQIFHGKRKEARKFGVFDNFVVRAGDIAQEEAALGRSRFQTLCLFDLLISYNRGVDSLSFNVWTINHTQSRKRECGITGRGDILQSPIARLDSLDKSPS